jgi:hypothetical protein
VEIGSGIAIAGSAFAVAGVAVKWISSVSNNSSRQCNSHAMIAQQIEDIKEWLHKIEAKLDRVIERL